MKTSKRMDFRWRFSITHRSEVWGELPLHQRVMRRWRIDERKRNPQQLDPR